MDDSMLKMKEYKDPKEQYKKNETILARIVKSYEEAYVKRMKEENQCAQFINLFRTVKKNDT